jgi:hypothetical protein
VNGRPGALAGAVADSPQGCAAAGALARGRLLPGPRATSRAIEPACIVPSRTRVRRVAHPMHQNPVRRGLVAWPELWAWSSFRAYAYAEVGMAKLNDWPKPALRGIGNRTTALPATHPAKTAQGGPSSRPWVELCRWWRGRAGRRSRRLIHEWRYQSGHRHGWSGGRRIWRGGNNDEHCRYAYLPLSPIRGHER